MVSHERESGQKTLSKCHKMYISNVSKVIFLLIIRDFVNLYLYYTVFVHRVTFFKHISLKIKPTDVKFLQILHIFSTEFVVPQT